MERFSIWNKPNDDCVPNAQRESWKLNPGYCIQGWLVKGQHWQRSNTAQGINLEIKTGNPNKGGVCVLIYVSMSQKLQYLSYLTWATKAHQSTSGPS